MLHPLDQKGGRVLVHVRIRRHLVRLRELDPRLLGGGREVGGERLGRVVVAGALLLLDRQCVEEPAVLVLGVQLRGSPVHEGLLGFSRVQHRLLCLPCTFRIDSEPAGVLSHLHQIIERPATSSLKPEASLQ